MGEDASRIQSRSRTVFLSERLSVVAFLFRPSSSSLDDEEEDDDDDEDDELSPELVCATELIASSKVGMWKRR